MDSEHAKVRFERVGAPKSCPVGTGPTGPVAVGLKWHFFCYYLTQEGSQLIENAPEYLPKSYVMGKQQSL